MNHIDAIYHLYLLKEVDRKTTVKDRWESTAEHTYSNLILAQYFLTRMSQKIDELKVMKLLLYHDVVEIESGDTFVLDHAGYLAKQEKERAAFEVLKKKVSPEVAVEIDAAWKEYEEKKTIESRFAQAIDKLDPIVHEIRKKKDWIDNKFSEEKLRAAKEKYLVEFPLMLSVFEEFVTFARENGYFENG